MSMRISEPDHSPQLIALQLRMPDLVHWTVWTLAAKVQTLSEMKRRNHFKLIMWYDLVKYEFKFALVWVLLRNLCTAFLIFLSLSSLLPASLYCELSNNSIKCKKQNCTCTIPHGLQTKITSDPFYLTCNECSGLRLSHSAWEFSCLSISYIL